jgi:hypothetical protein
VTFQTTDQPTAAGSLRPYRSLIAFVLLGAAGLQLLRIYWTWLVSFSESPPFGLRSLEAAGQFTSVPALTLPLLAVLITTMTAPVAGQAKQVTLIALGEYALTAIGALITALAGIVAVFSHPGGVLVSILIDRLVMLILLAVAVFVVLRIYLGMFVRAAPSAAYGGGYPVQSYPGYPQQTYQQPTYGAQPATQQAYAAQQAEAARQAQATQHTQQQQYGTPYGSVQPAPAQQAPYGYGQQTGQYPAAGHQAAQPPTSVPPAPAAEPATGSDREQAATQQPGAEQARPASGWPPAPASPWPPAPTSGGGTSPATGGSAADDPSKTQVFRPEQYRGNTLG